MCVCACVSGLADFFRDFVDDVQTLDSEALQRVPHWFRDDVPVCDWEGITADASGRIIEIDVRVADPELIGGECQLPNLKRVPLSFMEKNEDGDEELQGVKLITTAYLRSLNNAHPDVDITCDGNMTITKASRDQNGFYEAMKPFCSHVRVLNLAGLINLAPNAYPNPSSKPIHPEPNPSRTRTQTRSIPKPNVKLEPEIQNNTRI